MATVIAAIEILTIAMIIIAIVAAVRNERKNK